MIEFTIPGEPVGKARPRVAQGHAYTPQKTRDYEERVRWCWKAIAKGAPPLEGPVSVTIDALHRVPKSASKALLQSIYAGQVVPMKKPDPDNVAKIILDALNGLAYLDDKQVIRLSVNKAYDLFEAGCVIVRVEEAPHA